MLTLQNDPPSLDTVSEDKDQYKNYGKSIRKMIADCLQKDPAKRPSATELLKYAFFKKSKDKRYLVQTLLPSAPSIEERAKKAKNSKRPPGASGRLHRTNAGDWVWSDDDVSPENSHSDGSKSGSGGAGSGNSTCDSTGQTAADVRRHNHVNSDQHHHNQSSASSSQGVPSPGRKMSSDGETVPFINNITSGSDQESQLPAAAVPSHSDVVPSNAFYPQNSSTSSQDMVPPPINLVLRMRNSKKELNDIRFEFLTERGSCPILFHSLLIRLI